MPEQLPAQSRVQSDAGELAARDLVSHLHDSIEAERSQLSRELHDDMGGLIVGALMDVAWVETHLKCAPDILAKLHRAHLSLRAAVDLKRKLIEAMRPTLLDNVGLFAALQWHFTQVCEASKMKCDFAMAIEEPALPSNVAIAVFRLAQEALQLISKPLQAQSVSLGIEASSAILLLRFSHDGTAVEHPQVAKLPQFASMAHRISALHGTLTITPGASALALWCVEIPVGA